MKLSPCLSCNTLIFPTEAHWYDMVAPEHCMYCAPDSCFNCRIKRELKAQRERDLNK